MFDAAESILHLRCSVPDLAAGVCSFAKRCAIFLVPWMPRTRYVEMGAHLLHVLSTHGRCELLVQAEEPFHVQYEFSSATWAAVMHCVNWPMFVSAHLAANGHIPGGSSICKLPCSMTLPGMDGGRRPNTWGTCETLRCSGKNAPLFRCESALLKNHGPDEPGVLVCVRLLRCHQMPSQEGA
jgi:hypothetical protein